ncbi:MAG: HD-GYP domain-containing protein [Sphingomonas sp.]|jgi:putative nucleotidyltransferase with HDIG domain
MIDFSSPKPTVADFGDRRTYGEVTLFDETPGNALTSGDWRTGAPAARQPTRDPDAPRLYLNAKPGTLAQERDRAREIVEAAKAPVIESFDEARFGRRIDVKKLLPIVNAISASMARNCHALPSITRLKTRSEYTYLHCISVCGLMVGLAQEMRLGRAMTDMAGLAGLLHDIGKAAIPTPLLEKPGPLTDSEFDIVKQHPQRGADMLREMEAIPASVVNVVHYHHERMDGRGYPDGLRAGELELVVRMATVCDVYDAVTSTRSYKDSWSPGQAIAWMRSTKGHFDPLVLSAFIKMLGAFPPGTLVRLNSDRLALVVDDVDGDALNPSVMAFHCAVFDRPLKRQVLSVAQDPIASIENPGKWRLIDWSQMYEEVLNVGKLSDSGDS